MRDAVLPLWPAIPVAILMICGGLFALIGSLGLLRLPDFFSRMHAPTLATTLGTGCVLIASIWVSSILLDRPVIHELLIALFLTGTAPVTAIVLMRAAVARARRHSGGEQR